MNSAFTECLIKGLPACDGHCHRLVLIAFDFIDYNIASNHLRNGVGEGVFLDLVALFLPLLKEIVVYLRVPQ